MSGEVRARRPIPTGTVRRAIYLKDRAKKEKLQTCGSVYPHLVFRGSRTKGMLFD